MRTGAGASGSLSCSNFPGQELPMPARSSPALSGVRSFKAFGVAKAV